VPRLAGGISIVGGFLSLADVGEDTGFQLLTPSIAMYPCHVRVIWPSSTAASRVSAAAIQVVAAVTADARNGVARRRSWPPRQRFGPLRLAWLAKGAVLRTVVTRGGPLAHHGSSRAVSGMRATLPSESRLGGRVSGIQKVGSASTQQRRSNTLRAAVKSFARFVARRLPPPRGEAFLRTCVDVRDLVLGRQPKRPAPVAAAAPAPAPPPPPAVPDVPVSKAPSPFSTLARVARLSEEDVEWRSPSVVLSAEPEIPDVFNMGITGQRYDVELFEKLNAEYADKPLVPHPPQYDAKTLAANARRRTLWVHNMIDLAGKRTLEIGCGNGYEVWHVGEHLAADAYGVDVAEYGVWKDLAGERVHYVRADMTTDNPFEPDFFDRIYSFAVWEHVVHPYKLLEETYRVLKRGGLCWMNANLYPGPMASHRYRDINFPWPHLLFSEDVIKEWDRKHGHDHIGPAWINRLSWYHYQYYFDRIGFRLRHLKFTETAIDEEFYTRFEDILSRFPRWDLTKDFFLAVLEKPI
jgi:SAM-dependent methyltransferase